MSPHPDEYRFPNELWVLALTLAILGTVLVGTAALTFCASFLVALLFIGMSFLSTRTHHMQLMRTAHPVDPARESGLNTVIQTCVNRLNPGPVQVFVVPNRSMNAYTFGIGSPKVVVIYESLFKVMDAEELAFIIGHELGHVRLGHTVINSIVGGLAGVPTPFAVAALIAVVFRGWNRACEFSADRAGLIACGDERKAITALVKLVAPTPRLSQETFERVYRYLDAQDEDPRSIAGEFFATHPLMIRRIEELRKYAASPEYARIRARLYRSGGSNVTSSASGN